MTEAPGSSGPSPGSPRLFRWVEGYGLSTLRADALAGISVAVMLVPQSIAYAHLAGLPAAFGLYASVLPLAAYALLGTSLHLAVGVIAIDMLVLRAGLEDLAPAGTADYIELAILLTLMVGLIQVMMAVFRLGFLVNLLSRPVMVGFTSGAALLIALTQVGPITGVDLENGLELPSLAMAAVRHWQDAQLLPVLFGGGAIVILLLVRRFASRLPGGLLVVVGGTAAVVLSGLGPADLALVGEVPAGLPRISLPRVSLPLVSDLASIAITLALIQFLTVMSLAKTFAARFRYSIGHNRELLAIGCANVVGGFFRSLPVSGSFSRSAVNVEAGGRTPMVNLVSALTVALCLLFFTPLLALIPVSVLGAIIVVAALGLVDLQSIRFLLRAKTVDGWITLLTLLATLTLGILDGILIGVVASVLAILFRIGRPNISVLGHIPGTRSFRAVEGPSRTRRVEGILLLRIDASFSFMNAELLKDVLLDRTAATEPRVHAVVIDASSINDLDTTAAQVLGEVNAILRGREIGLYFGGVKEPVQKVLERSGLLEEIGPNRFHLSPHRAVRHILTGKGSPEAYLEQVNGETER